MKIHGRKSYIGFILLGVVGLAYSCRESVSWLSWFTVEVRDFLIAVIGSATGVAIRQAIKKSEAQAIRAADTSNKAIHLASDALTRLDCATREGKQVK